MQEAADNDVGALEWGGLLRPKEVVEHATGNQDVDDGVADEVQL